MSTTARRKKTATRTKAAAAKPPTRPSVRTPAQPPMPPARSKLCLVHSDEQPPKRGSGRGSPPPPIGGRLRAVRQQRNLTLGEVEGLCGISKSMLSQIERGKVNPTFATLWHITRSLGIGIGELLGEVQSMPEEVRRFEHIRVFSTPTITSADGLCTTRILSPRRYALPFEWYEIDLKPGGSLRANAHGNGEWEHTTVVIGTIVQEIGEDELTLEEGETIRYPADQPHGVRNDTARDAKLLLVVVPMKDLDRHNIPHGPVEAEG